MCAYTCVCWYVSIYVYISICVYTTLALLWYRHAYILHLHTCPLSSPSPSVWGTYFWTPRRPHVKDLTQSSKSSATLGGGDRTVRAGPLPAKGRVEKGRGINQGVYSPGLGTSSNNNNETAITMISLLISLSLSIFIYVYIEYMDSHCTGRL